MSSFCSFQFELLQADQSTTRLLPVCCVMQPPIGCPNRYNGATRFMAISHEGYATQILQSDACPGAIGWTPSANGVLSLSVMPSVHTALLRFSEELGIGKERPEHAPKKLVACGILNRCASTAVPTGICPNPRGRSCSRSSLLCVSGEKVSLLPRRETSSGSG